MKGALLFFLTLQTGSKLAGYNMRIKLLAKPPPPATLPNIQGVVLAGGLSSRLGHDKATLHLYDETSTLLDKTAHLLKELLGSVMIVGRSHPDYISIPDIVTGYGPVGGVTSALRHAGGDAILVLSCDLPFMEKNTLKTLLSIREKRSPNTWCTAFQQKETGHIEALVSIYEPKALPCLEACLKEKKLKLSKVIPQNHQLLIPYSAEESLPFFNINYPADLEIVRRMLAHLTT